jgi:hypothetical protein
MLEMLKYMVLVNHIRRYNNNTLIIKNVKDNYGFPYKINAAVKQDAKLRYTKFYANVT